jgi:ABC-type methionine transport system permease subunit
MFAVLIVAIVTTSVGCSTSWMTIIICANQYHMIIRIQEMNQWILREHLPESDPSVSGRRLDNSRSSSLSESSPRVVVDAVVVVVVIVVVGGTAAAAGGNGVMAAAGGGSTVRLVADGVTAPAAAAAVPDGANFFPSYSSLTNHQHE